MGNRLVAFKGSLLKNSGLGSGFQLRVKVFQRQQQRMIGVGLKEAVVFPRVDCAKLLNKLVIDLIEMLSCLTDLLLPCILQLCLKYLAHSITNAKHPPNTKSFHC